MSPVRLGAGGIDPGRFRELVAGWFAEHTPADWQRRLDALDDDGHVGFLRDWLRQLNRAGLGAPHLAPEWGGGGYSLAEQAILYEEWSRAGAPTLPAFRVSLHHVPATLLQAGTPAQRDRWIRPAVDGVVWCQGFSEPEAGSDLAALRTRAVRDGDVYRVTGRKTWSSRAQWADWCLLLVRTGSGLSGRQGISYVVLDMHAPGVEVRPIRQATGHADFCEIFLDGAEVPVANLLGAEDDGWAVAQRTLSTERGPLALETIEQINLGLDRLRAVAGPVGDGALSADQAAVARLRARAAAVRSLARDSIDAAERAGSSSLASVIKVSSSSLLRAATALGARLDGEDSLLDPGHAHPRGYVSGHWMTDHVHSWAWSIAGGTDEVQRNLIAERLLGLPRERRW